MISIEKGLAYCGLACCVCSENTNCVGCRKEGCLDKDACEPFRCCREKKIAGCWECSDFPCNTPMLQKVRVRAFCEYVKVNGEKALLDALKVGEKMSVKYHYASKLTGDYDAPNDTAGVIRMLDELRRQSELPE